jgi:energy-coupling factor transporter ATP-binding protein EcfA2
MDFYEGSLISAEVPPSAYIYSQPEGFDDTACNQIFLNSLRPELSDKVFKRSLNLAGEAFPEPNDNDESRKQWAQSLVHNFYVITPEIKELYEKVDRAIKQGYRQRLPLQVSKRQQQNLLISMKNEDTVWSEVDEESHRNNCILLLGPRGSGKSVTTDRIFNLYNQVIWHESTSECQITYLKIDLSRAGSVIEYCHRFLESLSAALGSAKFQQEVDVPRNETAALYKIDSLVLTYNVGIIRVDSLDHVLTWKSAHQQRLLTHFCSLGARVPILYTARTEILHSPVIVASRLFSSLTIGSIYLDPFKIFGGDEDETRERWQFFTKGLWKQQCLKNHEQKLSSELKQVWFDECKGIIKYAVLLFVHSQIEAIRLGEERISIEIMRDVAAKELQIFNYELMTSSVNEEQILGKSTVDAIEQSKVKVSSHNRKKNKKEVSVENAMPDGFTKVPKKDWLSLPEDDLRHTFLSVGGKNIYEALKLKKLILTNGELFGSVQFPKTIQG